MTRIARKTIVALFCFILCIQITLAFDSGYIPHRVYYSEDKKFSDFETMMTSLSTTDVIFVGEQHDDPATHRFELTILESLARRNRPVIVAMEMFERDTQKYLDNYLSGKITEEEFLKNSRPWGNYATDYRPLVEFAKAKGWRVIASNVPRKYAQQVSRGGLPVLSKLPDKERVLIARDVSAPNDDYFKNFAETMKSHPGADDAKNEKKELSQEERAMIQRIYEAQCVKDDTMAESIADAYLNAEEPKPLIVHFNGAFHSDYRFGTTMRTVKRLPKARIRVISVVPTEEMDGIKGDDYRKRGDYILFAFRAAKPKAEKQ